MQVQHGTGRGIFHQSFQNLNIVIQSSNGLPDTQIQICTNNCHRTVANYHKDNSKIALEDPFNLTYVGLPSSTNRDDEEKADRVGGCVDVVHTEQTNANPHDTTKHRTAIIE